MNFLQVTEFSIITVYIPRKFSYLVHLSFPS